MDIRTPGLRILGLGWAAQGGGGVPIPCPRVPIFWGFGWVSCPVSFFFVGLESEHAANRRWSGEWQAGCHNPGRYLGTSGGLWWGALQRAL